MPPAIIQAALDYKAALARHEASMMRDLAGRYLGIAERLQGEIDQIAATMAARRAQGLPVTAGYLHRTERYQALLAQTYGELIRYEAYAANLIARNQALYARMGQEYARQTLNIAEGGILGGFEQLNVAAIENIAGFVADGSPLRTLLEDAWPQAANQMTEALVTGVGLGYGPRRIARMMAQGLTAGLQRTLVIARTETMRAQRLASKEAWLQSGLVVGFQRVATHDRRTCPACLFAEGEFYRADEDFAEHPQGRCVLVPVTRRSGLHQWELGPEWFKRQSTETQIAILGKGRHALWQAGGFDLRDIPERVPNEVWGPGMRARSLAELAAGRPRGGWQRVPFEMPDLPDPEPEVPLFLDDGFPAEIERLETVRRLGGSTGAELVRDPVDGRLYVRKRGLDAGHLLEEVYADRAYQAMGLNVPKLHLYDTPQGPVKLAEFIEGRTLAELRSNRRQYLKAVQELRKGFAADALLGNWDVIGLGEDNILIDSAGKVWRIDNGGALRRRAQGQLKAVWNQYTDEFWTMRKPVPNVPSNTASHGIFGGLEYDTVVKQMKALAKTKDDVLAVLPADLQDIVRGRYEVMADLAKVADTLRKDRWKVAYIDDFSRHSIGLRKSGIVDKFPKRFTRRGVEIYDENGKYFDNLRGYTHDTLIGEFADYTRHNGGDQGIISFWAGQQAGDSWNEGPQAAKYFLFNQRDLPADNYWWKFGVDQAKQHYDDAIAKVGEQAYRETWTAWHAFSYEFVRRVEFPNNNLKRGVIKLMRTEAPDVMSINNLAKGQKGLIKRGPLESTSIYAEVTVFGSELTTQNVPHHRIFGSYFFERSPGRNSGMFLGDGENEFVALLDGLEVKYERSVR